MTGQGKERFSRLKDVFSLFRGKQGVESLEKSVAADVPIVGQGLEKPRNTTSARTRKTILVPQTRFMGIPFEEYVHEPRTEEGRRLLERRREETEIRLANVVISWLANEMPLTKLCPPLSLLETHADPTQISLNLLIGREDLRTRRALEQASRAFLVGAVVKTSERLWESDVIEVPAPEKAIVRHLQALKAKRWTLEEIATQVCKRYGLPIDEYYKRQSPRTPKPPQNPEPKFIRI